MWRAVREAGAADAREQLFELYTGLARRIASHHFRQAENRTIEFADLRQLAYAGLLEAIDRFDPAYGVSFARYAERRITGSVLDGLQHASEMHEQQTFRQRMRRERAHSLAGEGVDAMSAVDALDRLVEAAVGLAIGFMLEGDDTYVPDGATDRRPNAYQSTAWRELVRKALLEVNDLPERERLIIRQHYLEGVDFDRLGELLRLSKGRISQLHRAALARLRTRLNQGGQFGLER